MQWLSVLHQRRLNVWASAAHLSVTFQLTLWLAMQRIRVEEITQHPWLLGQQMEPTAPVEQSFQTESDIHSIVERARQRRLQQRNSRKLHTVPSGIDQMEE